MAVVLVLLDALRYDYINDQTTPFLNSLTGSSQYYKHIVPSYGFCERTEILSGLKPDQSGYFTAIGYDIQGSPFFARKENLYVDRIFEMLPEQAKIPFLERTLNFKYYFRKIYSQYILKNRKTRNSLKPYNIPFSFLPYFNLTEDSEESPYENVSKQYSILKLLEESGKSYSLESFTSLNDSISFTDEERFQMTIESLRKKEISLHLVYNSTADHYGHDFGPGSQRLIKELQALDNQLEVFICECLKIDKSTTFIILGDHGMEQVLHRVDVIQEVNAIAKIHKLKLIEDYIYFADSTMFRIWYHSKKARVSFKESLSKSNVLTTYGNLLNSSSAKEFNIPLGDKRYGDELWLANNGVLITPDFFNTGGGKQGMHGYSPNQINSHGTCIVTGENTIPLFVEKAELSSVYSILKEYLGL